MAYVELWSLSREALAGLLETNPHIRSKIQAVAAERLSVELESLTSQIESRLSVRSSKAPAGSNLNSKAPAPTAAAATHQLQPGESQDVDDDEWGEVIGDEVAGDEGGAAAAPPYERLEQSVSTPSIYLSTPIKVGRAGGAPSPGHSLPPSEHLFRISSDGGDDESAALPDAEPNAAPDAAQNVRTSAWVCAATSFSVDSFRRGGMGAGTGTDELRRASTMCVAQRALAPGKAQRLGGGVGRRWSAAIGCANAVRADERVEHKVQTFDELCNATADSIREGGDGEAAGLATIETMRRALGKIQGKKVLLLAC